MKKILIVEDETALLTALTSSFERTEIKVVTAQDGDEGLKVALREHPDLILLDLLMPKMDGIAMLHKLREDAWGKDVKVIVLTNSEDQRKAADALKNGVYDYFIKSDWNIKDVVGKVQTELENIK